METPPARTPAPLRRQRMSCFVAIIVGVALAVGGSGVFLDKIERDYTFGPPGAEYGGYREVVHVFWPAIAIGAALIGLAIYRLFPTASALARFTGTGTVMAIGTAFAIFDLKQGNSGPLFDQWSDGRPLRDEDGSVLLGPAPNAIGASPGAAYWLEASRHEASSVAMFEVLAGHLAHRQAPTELIAMARAAAQDERRHEGVCREIARRLGADVDAEAPALPAATGQIPSVSALAAGAFTHGVVGEGFAVERLALGAKICDPCIAGLLRELEIDERRHVDLGRKTIAWALANGDEDVTAALRTASENLPATVQLPDHLTDVPHDERKFAGICHDAQVRQVWQQLATREQSWLERCLATQE